MYSLAADDLSSSPRGWTCHRAGQARIHEFDSAAQWETSGRADILIFYAERPLAVLEIKREDLTLTHTDYEQAQSYANQLTPRPPLVIVTNGAETRVYDANTGRAWSGIPHHPVDAVLLRRVRVPPFRAAGGSRARAAR